MSNALKLLADPISPSVQRDPLPTVSDSFESDPEATDHNDNSDSEAPEPPEQSVEGSVPDDTIAATIDNLVLEYDETDPTVIPGPVRSRVCGDIFHLHHQFPIAMHHGLRRPFMRALSASLFVPHPEDKAAVEAFLRNKGTSYNVKLLSKHDWVLKRVRRYVPPPEILLPRVSAVIKAFGPLKDAKTGQPLFNSRACEIAQNVLENIRLGHFSDPPNVQLYYEVGKDKDGLTIFRCCRGTNDVEGGVHQNLIRRFTSFNVSPRHAVNLLLDYVTCHNAQVCVSL